MENRDVITESSLFTENTYAVKDTTENMKEAFAIKNEEPVTENNMFKKSAFDVEEISKNSKELFKAGAQLIAEVKLEDNTAEMLKNGVEFTDFLLKDSKENIKNIVVFI